MYKIQLIKFTYDTNQIKFTYETNQTVSELKMTTITERQGLTVEQVTHVDWNLSLLVKILRKSVLNQDAVNS